MAVPPHRSSGSCGKQKEPGDRDTPEPKRICNFAISPKLHRSVYPKRCAMWKMSSAKALIFVAAVVIAVALLVLLAR